MSTLKVNTISEQTAGNGVTIDGVLAKDGGIQITGFDLAPLPVAGHPTFRSSAANLATRVYIVPNGTPAAGLQAGLKMFNSDFWVDPVNYGDLGVWAGSDYNYINAKKNGTGSRKDLVFSWDDTNIVGCFKMSDGSGYLGLGLANTAPAAALDVDITGSGTNTAQALLRLGANCTGTPAAGYGIAVNLYADTNGAEDRFQARLISTWVDATDATRKAKFTFYVFDTAQREAFAVSGLGAEAGVGFFGVTPAARASHIANPAGGGTTDAEARTAINSILTALETFGLLKTA